jgi:hypothetical protein
MENVTKKLPLIISIATALTFTIITVHQTGVIKDLRIDLVLTKKALAKSQEELKSEMEKNEALESERIVLLDSIGRMGFEIADLNDQVGSLAKKISSQNKKIQQQADQIARLNKRINDLKGSEHASQAEIARLQAQLENVLAQMEMEDADRMEMKRLQEELASQKARYESEILQLRNEIEDKNALIAQLKPEKPASLDNEVVPAPIPKINEAPQNDGASQALELPDNVSHEDMVNIVKNTSVNFLNVSLKNDETGKDLKKIKDDNWRYTFVTFDLDNADKEAIIGQTFVLQLFDVDKGEPVAFNEINAAYPQSGQGSIGHTFKYNGEPVLVKYCNYQKKESSNYEVRLLFMTTKMALPLKNGKLAIVEDGKAKPII